MDNFLVHINKYPDLLRNSTGGYCLLHPPLLDLSGNHPCWASTWRTSTRTSAVSWRSPATGASTCHGVTCMAPTRLSVTGCNIGYMSMNLVHLRVGVDLVVLLLFVALSLASYTSPHLILMSLGPSLIRFLPFAIISIASHLFPDPVLLNIGKNLVLFRPLVTMGTDGFLYLVLTYLVPMSFTSYTSLYLILTNLATNPIMSLDPVLMDLGKNLV